MIVLLISLDVDIILSMTDSHSIQAPISASVQRQRKVLQSIAAAPTMRKKGRSPRAPPRTAARSRRPSAPSALSTSLTALSASRRERNEAVTAPRPTKRSLSTQAQKAALEAGELRPREQVSSRAERRRSRSSSHQPRAAASSGPTEERMRGRRAWRRRRNWERRRERVLKSSEAL